MENVGGWGNGIAAQEKAQAGLLRGGDEPESQGLIAADIPVKSRG